MDKYRQEHREDLREYDRMRSQNNPGKEKERSLKYRQNNREELRKKAHEYYRRSRGLPEDVDLHKESSIEVVIREWLQDNNIAFEQEYYINLENLTYTKVDFYIPEVNICLYVDGDYWHSLLEVQERDIRINKALEKMGYNVVRMTETEILEGNRPDGLKIF